MKKLFALLLTMLFFFALTACKGAPENTYLTANPYENVDWKEVSHVKTNLHAHTTESPCAHAPPHTVVDFYHHFEYGALAITDHDLLTYPWTFSEIHEDYQDRNPEELGMIAIPGNELTNPRGNHDMNALFTEYVAPDDATVDQWFEDIHEEEDSFMFFAHPGRYWKIYEDYEPGEEFSPEWYLNYFDSYPMETLAGIEVYNRNNVHIYDRALWDRLLVESMPERPIWGFANDDYHGETKTRAIHHSYTHHLIDDSTSKEALRQSMLDGAFYASYTRQVEAVAPKIAEILVDQDERFIEIQVDEAFEYDEIRWISGVDEETGLGDVVHRGERFEYASFTGSYVRAEIVYEEGAAREAVTLTQPFGFVEEERD